MEAITLLLKLGAELVATWIKGSAEEKAEAEQKAAAAVKAMTATRETTAAKDKADQDKTDELLDGPPPIVEVTPPKFDDSDVGGPSDK